MYSELPFLDRFRAAKDDGFDFVEFWGWTDKDLDAVKAAAEKAGVGISGFNGDAELSLIDPERKTAYLDFLKQSVAAAKKVGARSVTIHSNGLGEGGVVINHYDELSDTVKLCAMYDALLECARIAEESGIQMNLEPLNITTDHVGNFLQTTRMAPTICSSTRAASATTSAPTATSSVTSMSPTLPAATSPAPARSTTPTCLPAWKSAATPVWWALN